MRRNAGAYLRYKRTMLLMLLAAGGGIIVGLWLGYVLHQMIGAWLDGVWVSIAMGCAILIVIVASWIAFRSVERGRLERLEKGENAEVRTGQTIEYAITAPNCAVAHTVTDIARVGDVDHIVATPVRLWVIETRSRELSAPNASVWGEAEWRITSPLVPRSTSVPFSGRRLVFGASRSPWASNKRA